MSISAPRRPHILPFTAKVCSTCAQLVRIQARHREHVVMTRDTPDTTHPPTTLT